MEDGRPRQLTTRAVGAALVLAGVSLAVGAIAAVAQGEMQRGVTPEALGFGALARFDAAAWTSLGVLLLLLTPTVRVAGILGGFVQEKKKTGSIVATAALLTFMLGSLVFTPQHGPAPPAGEAAPLGSAAAGTAPLGSATSEGQ